MPPSPDANAAGYLFLLGIVLITMVLLRRIYRRRSTRPRHAGRASNRNIAAASNDRPTQPLPKEAQQWEVAMHETARELAARLDSKMVGLQQLLHAAEEERRRLEELIRSQGNTAEASSLGDSSAAKPTTNRYEPPATVPFKSAAERSGGCDASSRTPKTSTHATTSTTEDPKRDAEADEPPEKRKNNIAPDRPPKKDKRTAAPEYPFPLAEPPPPAPATPDETNSLTAQRHSTAQ